MGRVVLWGVPAWAAGRRAASPSADDRGQVLRCHSPTPGRRQATPPQHCHRAHISRSHPKAMASAQASEVATEKGLPLGMDVSMVDEYASQSKLLQEFVKIPTIGKAWIFNSKTENTSRAIVSVGQTDIKSGAFWADESISFLEIQI